MPPYPPQLSAEAQAELEHLGVQVQTRTLVTTIQDDQVTIKSGDRTEQITAKTILWAAGMKASPMGEVLAKVTGVTCDRAGRVIGELLRLLRSKPELLISQGIASA